MVALVTVVAIVLMKGISLATCECLHFHFRIGGFAFSDQGSFLPHVSSFSSDMPN